MKDSKYFPTHLIYELGHLHFQYWICSCFVVAHLMISNLAKAASTRQCVGSCHSSDTPSLSSLPPVARPPLSAFGTDRHRFGGVVRHFAKCIAPALLLVWLRAVRRADGRMELRFVTALEFGRHSIPSAALCSLGFQAGGHGPTPNNINPFTRLRVDLSPESWASWLTPTRYSRAHKHTRFGNNSITSPRPPGQGEG